MIACGWELGKLLRYYFQNWKYSCYLDNAAWSFSKFVSSRKLHCAIAFWKKKERETNLQILPLICFLPVEKLGQSLSQSMSAASTALLQKSTYILMPLNDMQLGSTIFWNSEQMMVKIKEGIQK